MSLRIAENLALPTEAITKTFALLAQRRKGKTYTASVMAEEMVDDKLPWVALDPTGAWWGLRSSADGKSAGLPVYVFGGDHGDLPLERTAGALIADVVVDHPAWYVLDFSHFESKEAERQFATDFAERFYRRKGTNKAPMHLFVDEADMFCPQRVPFGDQRMLGAFESIVRRGGIRGIGTTLISQRAAVLNKNVLEQIDVLIALRTVGPNDRKAIAGYVEAHGSTEQQHELIDSIAGLGLGEAWVWEPGEDLFQRVQIRQRRTFNSSATPDSTKQALTPARMAPVDLEKIRHQLATLVQTAEQDDPKELRRQVRELQAQLGRQQPREVVRTKEVVKTVEVPVLQHDELARLENVAHLLAKVAGEFGEVVSRVAQRPGTPPAESKKSADHPTEVPAVPAPPIAGEPNHDLIEGWRSRLNEGEQRMLEVLLRAYPMALTRAEVALRSHYTNSGGGRFWGNLSRLKRAGLVDFDGTYYRASASLFTQAAA